MTKLLRERCYIGLGSNLGDSASTLDSAVEAIRAIQGLRDFQISSLYQSKPHGPQDQPDYINAVASFTIDLAPEALLDALQAIENSHGRVRKGAQWTARTLDLDILLYGNHRINTDRLTVPHAWMKQREFVLYPLSEIAPNLSLPDGSVLRECLARLDRNNLQRLPQTKPSEMRVITRIAELHEAIADYKQQDERVGFVPTMGNLHAGHLDLVDKAMAQSDRVVVSIFVNPTQFDRSDDLVAYPRTMNEDLAQLARLGVDLVFSPEPAEMYPHGGLVTEVDVPAISHLLEGESRPGHFKGVATVVCKLFNIVMPDVAVFGQKDFQQLALIKQMVTDLDMPIEIIGAPTVRESNGLAMSSRNNRLSTEQLRIAPLLYQVLKQLEAQLRQGDFNLLAQQDAMQALAESGFKPDYIKVCSATTLLPANESDQDVVILAAAYLGDIRLIDNLQVSLPG